MSHGRSGIDPYVSCVPYPGIQSSPFNAHDALLDVLFLLTQFICICSFPEGYSISFLLIFQYSSPHSSRPPLGKLLQVLDCGDTKDKPPLLVGDDGKLLLPGGTLGLAAAEEVLKILEGRLHGNDTVGAAAALEACHGGGELVLGLDLAAVEQRLQMRDGEVSQQGAGIGVDDGQVSVVTLERREEGEGDGVGGVEGEGGGRVEVLDGGLGGEVLARYSVQGKSQGVGGI